MSKEAVSARKKVCWGALDMHKGTITVCVSRARKDGRAMCLLTMTNEVWNAYSRRGEVAGKRRGKVGNSCVKLKSWLLVASLRSSLTHRFPPLTMSPPFQELAVWLREELVKLGPTFIKV